MAVLKNRAKMSTSTTGTGTITLGSAEDGYQTFADAGVANADVVRYVIEDGNNFEIGTGTYTSSGTTLSRTVSESSNSDAAINLSGSATVFIGATAEDIPALYAANDVSATAPTASGNNSVAIGNGASVSADDSIVIGTSASTGSSFRTLAIGYNASAPQGSAVALGRDATAGAGGSTSIGRNSSLQGSVTAGSNTAAMALGGSYASGTDSLAAAIANNTSSYGATGANSIAMGKLAKTTNTGGVAIGENNIAQGDLNASAIGGKGNTASGYYAIASGGQNNSVTGARSGILAGSSNTVSGSNSVILGGASNTASGQHCFIFGQNSTASETYAIATGYYAKAAITGKKAHASGSFAAAGDAQGGQFILRADTTDATATVLTTTNSAADTDNQIVAASDTCITFDGTITAMQNGAQAYASWKIEGLLVNDGGTTTLANSATTVIQNSSGWGMALSADNTNNALAITCTGEASHNIRWVANIRTTECTFA